MGSGGPRPNSGGKRIGAGRPKGSHNKRTNDQVAKAAAGGELPLEYMLRVMRDVGVDIQRRDDMAKAAANYIHPRLQTATIGGDETKPAISVKITF